MAKPITRSVSGSLSAGIGIAMRSRCLAASLWNLYGGPGAEDDRRLGGEDAAVAVGDGGLGAGHLAGVAFAAQLPDGLDQHEQAVHAGVAVGKAAAVGVDRQ